MEDPPPLSPASPVERFSLDGPPPPGRSRGLLPPPARGRAVWGDWPDGRARGGERISAGCSHQAVEMLFPGSASMGYRPAWEGLTGRGWNIPLPCLMRLRLNGVHRLPPPPGRSRGLLPPPARGRAVWGDWPDGRARGGERIFQECQVRPRRDCQIPGDCIHGISPRGGGADGEGVEHSPPLSPVSPVERYSLEHPHLPAAHAASSRPLPRGRAVDWRLARWPCPGLRQELWGGCQVRPRRDCQIPGHRIHGESPRGGRGSPVAGVEHPPPLSPVSAVERFSLDGPPPPGRSRGLLPPPSEGAGS